MGNDRIEPGYTALPLPLRVTEQVWPDGVAPLVSVLCITYNQRHFVQECLHRLLTQETTFPIEIIVHDDASTDGTQEIIRAYGARYPTLLKTILRSVNQYSLGKKPALLASEHASGEYIALCDGDDYWLDKRKLELQVAQLAKHSTCDICFHAAFAESCATDICAGEEVICSYGSAVKIFDVGSIIAGGGGFCPTASLLIRRRVYGDLPAWYLSAPVGDYYIQIIAAARGGAVYIPRPMSVYRIRTSGSWSEQINVQPRRIPFLLSTMRSLHEVNMWLDGKYSDECILQILNHLELLRSELIRSGAHSGSGVVNLKFGRKLTVREKLARFRNHVSAMGFVGAMEFAIGHRLVLLGSALKRSSRGKDGLRLSL